MTTSDFSAQRKEKPRYEIRFKRAFLKIDDSGKAIQPEPLVIIRPINYAAWRQSDLLTPWL